ncbi:MAG: hypothetical protein EBT09_04580 [Actinobacteria bacterium]|nr:hypothetical protein [Actinomycetota bacterium]
MKSRLPLRYWLQFSASSISNVGDGLAVAATPLLALSLTDDTRLIGAVSFASSLPWLILTLPAGVIIDLVRSLANNPSLPAWRRDPAATRELFTKFDLQRRMAAMGLWPPPGK